MKSIAWSLLFACSLAFAQTADKGASPDGARPADGAIKGGTIAPGETAGTPDARGSGTSPNARGAQRCNELSGSLREQCLDRERDAAAGANRPLPLPQTPDAPPPNNPR